MSGFIAWLEEVNEHESRVRAVLRRSLAFDPATHIPAYPYVEPFLKGEVEGWRRQMYYLAGGLWAAHWREGRISPVTTLSCACAFHQLKSGSTSTERRFIHLLDADREQLPNRLRQMVALLNEQSLDFQSLLNDLLFWSQDDKRVQNKWAREFYYTLTSSEAIDAKTETSA